MNEHETAAAARAIDQSWAVTKLIVSVVMVAAWAVSWCWLVKAI